MPTRVPSCLPASTRGAALALAGLALVGGVATGCTKKGEGAQTPPTSSDTQGTTPTGGASFRLPRDPGAAIRSAGLREISIESPPVLDPEQRAHLDVSINDQPVSIPANVGMTKTAKAPIHTSDESGVIRIVREQTEKPETLTVGQFFTQWGVKLDKNCLATYCTDEKNQLLGYLNGQLVPDPASIPLTDKNEIVIWFGPKGSNPKVPASYAFTTTSSNRP